MIESPAPRMSAVDVVTLCDRLEARGISIWIDGGWAVDALLGRETRPHADLDVAIERRQVEELRALLNAGGYRDIPRNDSSPWNFVLGDAQGRRVDVHVIVFDAAGNGVLGPPENGHVYPAGSLNGSGAISGRIVRCIAAEFMVRFRTGYPPRPSDRHDVGLLCEHFGIPLPEEYR